MRLLYSPSNGRRLPARVAFTAALYRAVLPVVWNYNPWSGRKRDQLDVLSDPAGRALVPPGEPLRPHGGAA